MGATGSQSLNGMVLLVVAYSISQMVGLMDDVFGHGIQDLDGFCCSSLSSPPPDAPMGLPRPRSPAGEGRKEGRQLLCCPPGSSCPDPRGCSRARRLRLSKGTGVPEAPQGGSPSSEGPAGLAGLPLPYSSGWLSSSSSPPLPPPPPLLAESPTSTRLLLPLRGRSPDEDEEDEGSRAGGGSTSCPPGPLHGWEGPSQPRLKPVVVFVRVSPPCLLNPALPADAVPGRLLPRRGGGGGRRER